MPDILTKQDYAEYQQTVARFIKDRELSFISTGTYDMLAGEDPETGNQDPWFSWHPCECCQSHLGGNREHLYARNKNGDLVQFTICVDCVYYVNYGQLDDQTMMRAGLTR